MKKYTKLLTVMILMAIAFLGVNAFSRNEAAKEFSTKEPVIQSVNIKEGETISLKLGNGVCVQATRKDDEWSVGVSMNYDSKTVMLFSGAQGSNPWMAIKDDDPDLWIVDNKIDGRPDWRGLKKGEREIFKKWDFEPIKEVDASNAVWKSGDDFYSFDKRDKSYNIVEKSK